MILTRPEVAVLTLCRRKPSSTGFGNSQSNLGCLFNIAVSAFVEWLDIFPPIYFLCFYCLGDGFWAESVGLPEYFLGCLHLLRKSLAISYFSQLWRHVGLNCTTCKCHGNIGTLSASNSAYSRVCQSPRHWETGAQQPHHSPPLIHLYFWGCCCKIKILNICSFVYLSKT